VTLFRSKYYLNAAHAGYILYKTDAGQSSSDVDRMRQALRDTKGPGNFRNLFMYEPIRKQDGIEILPFSEVATKDDFFTSSRRDLLSAHRVPPKMMGIIPDKAADSGIW
jgi:capsid portal protein